MLRKLNSVAKDLILVSRIAYIIYPFRKFLLFLYNLSELTVWINRNKNKTDQSDFFRLTRNYHERLNGFAFITDKYQLQSNPVSYFEFGVASGVSFEWWLQHAKHADSKFFGFDTFEGLPEDWGLFFKKGAMAHDMKAIADKRHHFVKGIFQDTMRNFVNEHRGTLELDRRKVLLFDADLFSSTIYVLTQLYPYLHKGDVLIFDEFNVPSHEFYAMKIFQDCFYVKLRPVSAINNFYQTAFEIEKI